MTISSFIVCSTSISYIDWALWGGAGTLLDCSNNHDTMRGGRAPVWPRPPDIHSCPFVTLLSLVQYKPFLFCFFLFFVSQQVIVSLEKKIITTKYLIWSSHLDFVLWIMSQCVEEGWQEEDELTLLCLSDHWHTLVMCPSDLLTRWNGKKR